MNAFARALLFAAGAVAAGAATAGPSLESIIEPLRVDVEQERVSSRTPGIQVALMIGGEIVWSEGFGWGDVENEIPVTPATRFGIGSISKTLTMITCARLVDEGSLDWDAPVESYLPEFPYAGRGITIRSIGAHLSQSCPAGPTPHRPVRWPRAAARLEEKPRR